MNVLQLVRLATEDLPYDPNQVTPGVIGFAVTAAIAAVVALLVWDLNRRVRRMHFRAQAREIVAAELAERDAALAAGHATATPHHDTAPHPDSARGDAQNPR